MPDPQVQLRGRSEISPHALTGEERRQRLVRLRSHLEGILRRAAAAGVHVDRDTHERLHGRDDRSED